MRGAALLATASLLGAGAVHDALSPPDPDDAAAIDKFYAEHGFVYFPALLPPSQVKQLNRFVDGLVEDEVGRAGYNASASERSLVVSSMVTKADYDRVDKREDVSFHFDKGAEGGPPLLRSVNNLYFSEGGAELARDGRVLDVVRASLGDDALGLTGGVSRKPLLRFFNSRCFAKPPGGAGTAWHRDVRFFDFMDRTDTGATRRVINGLVLLDEQTPANGAMRLVPGSHTNHSRRGELNLVDEFGEGLRAAQARAQAGDRDAPVLPGEFTLAGLPVGSVVLVDHFTLHGSGESVAGAGRRRMLSLGYAGPHLVTRDGAPPRNIAVEGAREAGEVNDYFKHAAEFDPALTREVNDYFKRARAGRGASARDEL